MFTSRELIRRACIGVCAVVCAAAVPSVAMAQAQRSQASAPAVARAQNEAQIREELERLRQEFEAIRDAYGARLAALEARLGVAPVALPAVTPPAPPPAGAAEVPPPVSGNPSAMSKIFNPDIAVIGNFLGTSGSNTVNPAPALELKEAELSLQAIVDPYARADFFIAGGPDGFDLEEGFLTLTSLPGRLLAKVGKMKQQFGKVNTLHPHSLGWADQPLVMTNLLGGEEGLNDSGVSVSTLILNPWFFLEATGEVYQGNSGIFTSYDRSDVSWLGRVRGYRDLTEGTNLDVGASYVRGHNDAGPEFDTGVFGVDATLRFRPLRRALYRRFMARTELLWSRREQDAGTVPAFGMYASGDYQFARRWSGGLRYDFSNRASDATLTDKGSSLVLTFWPSEFSQVRGQYRRTRYAEGVTANEAIFQFLFAIGAHGAHVF